MPNIMETQTDHIKQLTEIRNMMEKSSRFISLSGLSGVFAGIVALLGCTAVYLFLGMTPFSDSHHLYYSNRAYYTNWGIGYRTFFILDALVVFLLAIAGGIYFTTRKARRKGQQIFDKLTYRLLLALAIPLATGGLFSIGLWSQGLLGLVAPITLIFYGLALINASKYTLQDIYYLGISEIILGLLATFNLGYGLEFWGIGFGLLHIIYGTVMYYKYEKA